MKRVCTAMAIVLAGFCGPAYAGSGSGKVTRIVVHSNRAAMIRVESVSNQPACSTIAEFAINLDNSGGQAQYALLLAAHLNGASVTIIGAENCDTWGDRETVKYAYIETN